MQTILGSGGVVAHEIAKELKQFTTDIRLVSRNPKKVNETDSLFPADLTNLEQTRDTIKGSEVCYLAIGFKYNTKVWQEKWPVVIQNVVHLQTTGRAKNRHYRCQRSNANSSRTNL